MKSSVSRFTAYVSAPKDDETHPRKMVLNSFLRRGAEVFTTQGYAKCYTVGYSFKEGYGPVPSMGFSTKVEDYD